MKKLVAMIALGTVFGLSIGFSTVPDNDCQVTDELIIMGHVEQDELGGSVYQGKLINSSPYFEFKNVLIRADLCDDNGNIVHTQTFTVEDDVEKGETEVFEANVDPLQQFSSVQYSVVCAERDFSGI